MRSPSKSPIWTWVKVLLGLVVVDLLLFRIGVLWRAAPDFGIGLGAENWRLVFAAAREVETRPTSPPSAVIVGSSVVIFGAQEDLIGGRLRQDHIPVDFLRFVTHGSTATDSALMAWSARTFEPWLVIYGAAARDFPKAGSTESAVTRTFYDASVELPRLPRVGVESRLDAYVREYWKLYRYRFLTLTAFETAAVKRLRSLGAPQLFAAEVPAAVPPIPPEAAQIFPLERITPKTWAAWSRWRETRRFSDYLEWMKGSLALSLYRAQTPANYGPDDNLQAESLRWMLATLERSHTRTVLVYFPENPVFRDPEASAYFDPSLSDAYANLFKREAEAHGARFEDLRNFLDPEDFFDLVHANLRGRVKMSARIAEIVEEEWRARSR